MVLRNIRVIDLSRLFPGPYCSRILADFGAEVIKVEHPQGGDWVRLVPPLAPDGESWLFHVLNHGKKSLTLDLKADEGRRILLRLVETADVLLESFRPGVMERLGLGYEHAAAINPGLIYCSLSGYGVHGPYQGRAGHDLNYAGLSGLLDLTGPRDGPPVIPGALLADLSGGLWAALGILAALLAREGTGKGQRVDGSLLGGVLACMPLAVARHLGGTPTARGASELTGGWVCYNIYTTADGRYVTLAALEPQFWVVFCRAVGREDLLGDQMAPAVPGEPVYEALRALFRSRTQQEWVEALAAADACCEPLHTVEEALASAPVQALGMLTGQGLLPPVRLSDQPAPGEAPTPALGEHTESLLRQLGYDSDQVVALHQAGVV